MEVKQRGKGTIDATGEDIWTALPKDTFSDTAGYVFVLNRLAPEETKTFLVDALLKNQLTVSLITSSPTDKDLILLVTCDSNTLQEYAKHVYLPQQLQRQNNDEQDDHLVKPEQERVLLYILETIIQKERTKLVGFHNVTIYPGQSIGNRPLLQCM